MIFSPPPRHKRECNATAKYWLLAAALLISNGSALAADAAKAGRDGQAFGQSLADKFQFPTEGSGGSVNLGNGESIKPSDMAPKGEGFYVTEPNVGGLQGIYDSDETMHDVGRGAQNQLWQDAQLKGNPFDPDPAMRDQQGPSTVSGAVYQIITGVSDARAQVPDLTNDPIVNTAGDHMLNEDLLESFGDCSVETEVTETSRPVHVPDIEFCERVAKPAPANCDIKHDIELSSATTTKRAIVIGVPMTRAHRKVSAKLHNPHTRGGVLDHLYTEICTRSNAQDARISIKKTTTYVNNQGSSGNWGGDKLPVPYWSGAALVTSGGALGGSTALNLITVKPSCQNGLDVRFDSYAISQKSRKANVARIDLEIEYTAETTVVSKDIWRPQSCIEQAQKL